MRIPWALTVLPGRLLTGLWRRGGGQSFIVMHTGRVGSVVVGEMLRDHPHILFDHDPLHRRRVAWVARHGDNRTGRGGRLGAIEDRLRVVPWWAWLATFVAIYCLVPVFSDSSYVRRVAFDIAIYMLLALGLNVVVGWGGLLDIASVPGRGTRIVITLPDQQTRQHSVLEHERIPS